MKKKGYLCRNPVMGFRDSDSVWKCGQRFGTKCWNPKSRRWIRKKRKRVSTIGAQHETNLSFIITKCSNFVRKWRNWIHGIWAFFPLSSLNHQKPNPSCYQLISILKKNNLFFKYLYVFFIYLYGMQVDVFDDWREEKNLLDSINKNIKYICMSMQICLFLQFLFLHIFDLKDFFDIWNIFLK